MSVALVARFVRTSRVTVLNKVNQMKYIRMMLFTIPDSVILVFTDNISTKHCFYLLLLIKEVLWIYAF